MNIRSAIRKVSSRFFPATAPSDAPPEMSLGHDWVKPAALLPGAAPPAPPAPALDREQLEIFRDVAHNLTKSIQGGGEMMPYVVPPPNAGTRAYALDNPTRFWNTSSPKVRPDSQITTDTLRLFANNYDVLRSVIAHLQREVSVAPFKIIPADPADDRLKTKREIKEATDFFTVSGGLGGFGIFPNQFEYAWVEDLLVMGQSAFHFWKYLDGSLYQIVNVDASTIKPCVDQFGWPTFDGDNGLAFEQWVMGVKVQNFSRSELCADGLFKSTNTPYYKSPVEWLLSVITSALYADKWNRQWLTDGNIPDQLIGLPDTWTPAMVRDYQAYFDAILAGNMNERTKAKFVPGGTKMLDGHSRRDQEFGQFEQWLMTRTCAIFGVNPSAIGYSAGTFKAEQEANIEQTSAFGVGSLLAYREDHYNDFLQRAGWNAVRFANVSHRYEGPKDRAERNQLLVMNGIKTINEARSEEGLPPLPEGNTLMVQSAMIPLSIAQTQPNIPAGAGQQTDKRDNKSK